MAQPLVYISLVNWNRADLTIACIRNLEQQTYRHYRIIVVDNASSDDSVTQIKAQCPGVMLLCSDENGGYAGGHAITVQQALADSADLLWILNNDTVVEPQTLAHLVTAYQTHGNGLYGGIPLQMADDNQRIVLMHRKFLNPDFREVIFDTRSFAPYDSLFPNPQQVQRIAVANGSCILLPLAIVQQHGFMDTRYFLYSEEVDYCLQLGRANVPIWIVPEAIIWHEGEGSSSAKASVLSDIVQYYRIRNQLVRISRYGSSWDQVRAMVKNVILIAPPLLRGQFRRVGFMLRGMWDGMRRKLGKTYPPENFS